MRRILTPRRELILPARFRRSEPRDKLCSLFTPMPIVSSGFKVDSVNFNGTTAWLGRGASVGAPNNQLLSVFSAWVRPTAVPAGLGRIFGLCSSAFGSTDQNRVSYNSSAGTPAGVRITDVETGGVSSNIDSGNMALNGWYHILWAINHNSGGGGALPGGKNGYLYVNDASVGTPTSDVSTSRTGGNDCVIGAEASTSLFFTGQMAEIWYVSGSWLDITITANRRRFISATGKPVYLGADGSLPLGGSVPNVYLHLAKGETTNNFAINRGSGGNFTIHGSITTGSTSPSD